VTQTGARPYVFRNDQQTGHHWLRVRVVGDGSAVSTDAIGAWVELESGGVVQRRQVTPTRGYQSQSELPVTFGLGASESVEGLRVVWPDGERSEHPVDGVDRQIEIRRPS